MKNAMQLKSVIKKIAKEKNISAQLVLQNYMLERFLERVSVSAYQNNFIIKGGFLIASMVGLAFRATMDMDATIKRYPVSEETIQKMVKEIIEIDLEDDVVFTFKSIGKIREGDEYAGYRVALSANYRAAAGDLCFITGAGILDEPDLTLPAFFTFSPYQCALIFHRLVVDAQMIAPGIQMAADCLIQIFIIFRN